MVSCAVRSCKNATGKQTKRYHDVTFHKFPQDAARRNKWTKCLLRRNWQPSRFSVICSDHFAKECFVLTVKGLKMLKKHSVPTLSIPEEPEPIEDPPSPLREVFKVHGDLNPTPGEANANSVYFIVKPEILNKNNDSDDIKNETLPNIDDMTAQELNEEIVMPIIQNKFVHSEEVVTKTRRSRKYKDVIQVYSNKGISAEGKQQLNELLRLKYISDEKTRKVNSLELVQAKYKHKIDSLQKILNKIREKKRNLPEKPPNSRDPSGQKGIVLIEGTQSIQNRRYSEGLKAFAVSLYDISPKAYHYVREVFKPCLPNSRTLQKWEKGIDLLKDVDSVAPEPLFDNDI